jgi:uncharacterized protein
MALPISGEDPLLLRLIGSGARFPWAFSGLGGSSRIKIGSGMDKINGSIKHILSTRIGDRFFLPEFGSDLPALIFEPLDDFTKDQVHLHTVGALRAFEKRIIVESIGFDSEEVELDQSTLHVFIEYRLINSQVVGNYVFPWRRGTRPVGDEEG